VRKKRKLSASVMLTIALLVSLSVAGVMVTNAYSHGLLFNGVLNAGKTVSPNSLPVNSSAVQPLDQTVVYQKPSYCGMLFTVQINNNTAGVAATMTYPNAGGVYSFSNTINDGAITLTYDLAQSLPAGSYALSITVQHAQSNVSHPYTLSSTFENCQSQTPPPMP
jgi:methionine-rich copper-binding protein CopC